jgi:holo-[acyl-carrier protein] synthase
MKIDPSLFEMNILASRSQKIVVGNDLVHLPRFAAACSADFISRVFTPEEEAYCRQFSDPLLRFASTWAAKEAIYKAVKQIDPDIRIWWKDIHISRTKLQGKPSAQIPKLPKQYPFSLSVSHDGEYAWAIATCIFFSDFL